MSYLAIVKLEHLFYYCRMTLVVLSPTLLQNPAPGYILLAGERAAAEPILRLIAEIAPYEPVGVIDAGAHFNPHYIARRVRMQSTRVRQALDNIHIVRIFHAHQLPEALQGFQHKQETLVIMGGMVLFEDETMAMHHKRYVLNLYFNMLDQLSTTRHVVVGIKPREHLLQFPFRLIYERAAQLFEIDPIEEEPNLQPGLFDFQETTHG